MVFISLSKAGWKSGDFPSARFLKEWKAKFNIPTEVSTPGDALFLVAASPDDAGKAFYENPRVPNAVIIDPDGILAFKKINPGVELEIQEVKKLLP